jgi:DNA-binding MarR family transcriptional regulator
MSDHPIHRLDDDVHQRVRLGILALLTGVTRADFGLLKRELNLTDGNLGRHLETLEAAGLVSLDKTAEGSRSRTWIKITRRGRTALRREVRALRELIATLDTNLGDWPASRHDQARPRDAAQTRTAADREDSRGS